MSYTLSWYTPERVLILKLDGQPTAQELEGINQDVVDILDAHPVKLSILIDASNLKATYQAADLLRDTQRYMNHPRLDSALVVSESRIIRLITLIAFCTSRATFRQFNTMEIAEGFLRQRGFVMDKQV